MDDYGTLINPQLASGQIHGAIAQGVGQALYEQVYYQQCSGQLLSGSLMDYCLPRADDLVDFQVEHLSTPCTTNPFGVKGCGEAGAIAGFPAVTNAIYNALATSNPSAGHNLAAIHGAHTPFALWQAISGR